MALNLDKIRERQQKLLNDGKKSSGSGPSTTLWRPKAEKGEKSEYRIRFVPTEDGDPFKDLHFHYGVNGKSILCPKRNFDEKCPICDFASALWKQGVNDDDAGTKKQAKDLFVKQRFFAPIIVRDEEEAFYENEAGEKVEHGVRWYAFGRQTYMDLLELVMDPEYGDITDVDDGVDFTLTYDRTSDRQFPVTKLKPARQNSPLFKNKKKVAEVLRNIPDINELYKRMSTEEVNSELQQFLNVTDADGDGTEHISGNTEENDIDAALNELRAGA